MSIAQRVSAYFPIIRLFKIVEVAAILYAVVPRFDFSFLMYNFKF
jgi:hypothetical protein